MRDHTHVGTIIAAHLHIVHRVPIHTPQVELVWCEAVQGMQFTDRSNDMDVYAHGPVQVRVQRPHIACLCDTAYTQTSGPMLCAQPEHGHAA